MLSNILYGFLCLIGFLCRGVELSFINEIIIFNMKFLIVKQEYLQMYVINVIFHIYIICNFRQFGSKKDNLKLLNSTHFYKYKKNIYSEVQKNQYFVSELISAFLIGHNIFLIFNTHMYFQLIMYKFNFDLFDWFNLYLVQKKLIQYIFQIFLQKTIIKIKNSAQIQLQLLLIFNKNCFQAIILIIIYKNPVCQGAFNI
eukprot:TRINITY_DN3927_c0_g1_i2.p2 TRINITY_DN3927_c0_g1~~TRINITY_DN3927_c0_g1_i2.p2  ORF type:complete len:199 (-),score=-10.35 TRINITY_DN3927_c0_g1_i2:539-1135(-)